MVGGEFEERWLGLTGQDKRVYKIREDRQANPNLGAEARFLPATLDCVPRQTVPSFDRYEIAA